jgi:pseudouridine-5'-phosphate glycosidase
VPLTSSRCGVTLRTPSNSRSTLASCAVRMSDEVSEAIAARRPVVALESTIIAHGLPRPDNVRVAREIEAAVRDRGAVPATIAVLGGEVHVGLDDEALERIGGGADVAKCSVRDLPVVCARRADGATTVAATAHLAIRAGIAVFATGGIGGVHRDAAASFDESADLVALARTPVCLVCAGVKSILDAGATLERLETLGVTVAGYGTDRLAGFYLTDSGHDVPWRVESAADVAAIMRARSEVAAPGAVVIANPLPVDQQLDPALHDRVLGEALVAAADQGVHGKAITPFLLERLHRETQGESLRVNIALVTRNAALAGEIAVAAAAA